MAPNGTDYGMTLGQCRSAAWRWVKTQNPYVESIIVGLIWGGFSTLIAHLGLWALRSFVF